MSKLWDKIKGMMGMKNKRQDQLKKSLDMVYQEALKYLNKGDKQIEALKDYQLILGVTQVMWEDQVMRDISAATAQSGLVMNAIAGDMIKVAPGPRTEEERQQLAEMEFDQPEFMDKKKGMLH
jgi:hypothetical protein